MYDQNTVIKYVTDLVKLRTTTKHPENFDKCADYIVSKIKDKNVSIKRYKKNGKPSIVATIGKKHNLEPEIMLHGHFDVVEGEDYEFEPLLKNNRIYGRGALDMKGGISVLMYLLNHFAKNTPNKSFGVMFTSDEEVGGVDGTKYLLNEKGYKPKLFVTAEGEFDQLFKIKQKGVLHLKISAEGVGAHSSYQWLGVNAIEKLYQGYSRIQKLFPANDDSDHWYTTVNLGVLNGGHATNSIPDYAEAKIDIRYTEEWEGEDKLLKAVKKAAGKDIKVEVLMDGSLMNTSKQDPNVSKLHAVAQKTLGLSREFYYNNHGTNDARFAAEKGISTVAFGPVGKNYHAKNEYISLKGLKDYFNIWVNFMSNN